ncbi:hypothetical protein JXA85_06610 [Candidatus Woesearchaeota archaeon]|nr:hypothetical protein [Candidatus Woesearchaeota archaeon]
MPKKEAIKDKLLARVKDEEEKFKQEQERLKQELSDEQSIILEENSFSVELLNNSKYKSIEEQKLRTVEEIISISNNSGFIHQESEMIKRINIVINANRLLNDLIGNAVKKLKLQEQREESYMKPKNAIIDSDAKANKVIRSLILQIREDRVEKLNLKRFLNKGMEGLDLIEKKLSRIKDIDIEKEKFFVVLEGKLKELKKLIEEENRITKEMLNKTKKTDKLKELSTNLLSLLKTETEDHNNLLRDYYQHINLKDEEERVVQLRWLNEKEIEITQETILFMNQFIIPEMEFPSGNFVVYSTNVDEARRIISGSAIDETNARVRKKVLGIGSRREELSYVSYTINDILNINKCCFIFPVESAMKNHYFLIGDFAKGIIEIYGKGPNPGMLLREINETLPRFDILLKHVNQKYKEWLEEAKQLDEKFVQKWDTEAAEHINQDFTKRWIKEESEGFSIENKFSFGIVKFMVEQRYFTELFDRMLERKTKAMPQMEKGPDDYLEEMQAMSKERFIETIKLIKKGYVGMMADVRNFIEKASFHQEISEGIFLAPKSQVLQWERYFFSIKRRPNVFYYNGEDIKKGIEEAIRNCKKNRKNKAIKKTRFIRVFSYMNFQPLQTV